LEERQLISGWLDGGKCAYSLDLPPTISDTVNIPGFTDDTGKMPVGLIIEPSKAFGPLSYKIDVTQAQIDQAAIGVGKIFCAGLISYDDMRGNNRKTALCMIYNFGIRGWTVYPDKRFNFHT
jgi:hypothetical protein